jgi:TPR repeat protein
MIIATSRQTAVAITGRFDSGREPRSEQGGKKRIKKDDDMFQGHCNLDTAAPVEACANGDVLFDLGMLYASGRSGLVDLVAAHKWFNLAALKGRVDAIRLRREVAELMSDVEIAMAQREARAWMTTH